MPSFCGKLNTFLRFLIYILFNFLCIFFLDSDFLLFFFFPVPTFFPNVSWTISVVRMSLASLSPTRRVYPGYRAWEGQVRSEPTRQSLSISLVLERTYDYTRGDVFQGRSLLKLLPSLYSVNDDDDNNNR